jgi:hypothetical protein
MTARCELAIMLRQGGPVRAAMRMCCLLALVGCDRPTDPEKLRRGSYLCLAEDPDDILEQRPASSGVAT